MGGSVVADEGERLFVVVVMFTSVSAMHELTNSARAVFCMVNGRMLCSAMQFCPTRNG